MIEISKYRNSALLAFEKYKLIMGSSDLRNFHDEVNQCGRRELACLSGEFDNNHKTWGKIKTILKRKGIAFDEVTTRVLGFGWYQTQAFYSINQSPDICTVERLRLGALANFIISLYDFMLDSRLLPVIPQTIFSSLLENKHTRLRYISSLLFEKPSVRLMELLVLGFREKANGFMEPGEWQNLVPIISDACSVQNEVSGGKKVSLHLIEEKSVFPFLILAQIAQSAPLSSSLKAYINGLGRLIGMVDDLTDYEEDAENQAVNSINFYSMKNKEGLELFDEHLHKMICFLFVNPEINIPPGSRKIFVATLNSWLSSWHIHNASSF